jgi:hypothetical protein
MYKANKRHLQPPLISNVNELPEKQRQRLDDSWAGTFYREYFCRLNEAPFAVLYADCPSRPNYPVNVFVGLDTLKAGFGWSDEELYDHFQFDLQVRYALGYHTLDEGGFEIRSLYNFRRRLGEYNLEHGTNLLVQAFEAITDQQIVAFQVRTDQQRMDSTQVASNILDSSRLQLAAECVQRLARLLTEEDRGRYAQLLEPYLHDTTNQYVYRIKGKAETETHLQQIGQVLWQLLQEGKERYGKEAFFAVATRFFDENFRIEGELPQPKDNAELSSGSLQSLDDLEASYRQKDNAFYKGYVANAAETDHPDNELQLITLIQLAPNRTEDSDLMIEALPNLKRRTNLELLHTDGAFGSPAADPVLRQQHVTQIPSAIRGTTPNPEKLHLSQYQIEQDAQGRPTQLVCPHGQIGRVPPTQSVKCFAARFEPDGCADCPFLAEQRCRVLWRKRLRKYQLEFTQEEIDAAQRRRRCQEFHQSGRNLRAAVEATVRSLKHPWPGGKLPVRGIPRMTDLMVGSTAMTNIRRITRYLLKKRAQQALEIQENPPVESFSNSFSLPCFAFQPFERFLLSVFAC